MDPNNNSITANEAWKKLIDKYNIIDEIKERGYFIITTNQVKEFKEPRLMAKWDNSHSLPKVLKDNRINLLANSRRSYILSDFILYQEIPELIDAITQMDHVEIPRLESIDVNNISSEANAINVLLISGILNDFLETDNNVATFNGRMGTGTFQFNVNRHRGSGLSIEVNNAQCEIDGGFENDDTVIIMEAKNVVHEDFHVRQLYYPYRLWRNKVNKPIRLVFSIYSNMIFRLFEYHFNKLEDYSSIELLKTKNYSLQDTNISFDELEEVRKLTKIETNDDMKNVSIPFIQANSMERIISLLENLYDNPMTSQEIAELMNFDLRQSDYYYNAGRYLGLFEKVSDEKRKIILLSSLGSMIFKFNYKKRQLKLVELMLKHEVFAICFDKVIEKGELPEISEIGNTMRRMNVCGNGQIERRASSVYGWLKWIFNLTKL